MTLQQFQLVGKVAIVTGSSSGIGQAIAIGLAEAGADIVGVHHSTSNDETERAVRKAGRRFLAIRADLAAVDARACQAIVDDAIQHLGRIDVLVNNAGIIARESALEMTEQSWHPVLRTNLTAPFLLAQAAGRYFTTRANIPDGECRGKVINIASIMSFQGGVNIASYTASKAGLVGLTRLLANEWAPLGINVNAIAPGYIVTRANETLRGDRVRSNEILSRIPAGRWGSPPDLSGVAVFLASAASAYVHGAVIPVDGGWLAR